MSLGQRIKKLRTDMGLTQKDLADQVHVTFQTVSKWEKDENEPDVSTLRELSKVFGCTLDYLLSEDEAEKGIDVEVVPQVPKVEPNPESSPKESVNNTYVENKTIVIHHEPHVCARCGKDIEEWELASEDVLKHERYGRSTRTVSVGQTYYHKSCLEEVKKERRDKKRAQVNEAGRRAMIWCFVLATVGGLITLGIALPILLIGGKDTLKPWVSVLISLGASFLIFADVYCILSGSYVADIFFGVAKWSIRFPGIIFSLDLGGIFFLIAMKAIFAALGFLFGIFAFLLATALSSLLAGVSFPFILIKNIHCHYDDSVFYNEK